MPIRWIAFTLGLGSLVACTATVEPPSQATDEALAGGTVLTNAQYPYVVRVMSRSGTSATVCTGTLIGQDKVLTAAHCVMCAGATEHWIMLGNTSDITQDAKWSSNQAGRYHSKQVSVHPYFKKDITCQNEGTLPDYTHGAFDVAVIDLADVVPVAQAVGLPFDQIATSPLPGFTYSNAPVVNIGVGFTTPDQSNWSQVGVRRKGSATLDPDSVWASYACGGWGGSFTIGTTTTTSSFLAGDSGGPVLFHAADGKDHVLGVHGYRTAAGVDESAATYSVSNGTWLTRIFYPFSEICGFQNGFIKLCPYPTDTDCDGIADAYDNCKTQKNFYQQGWTACP